MRLAYFGTYEPLQIALRHAERLCDFSLGVLGRGCESTLQSCSPAMPASYGRLQGLKLIRQDSIKPVSFSELVSLISSCGKMGKRWAR